MRAYQEQAIDSVLKYFQKGNKGHPLVVLPTGAGKTHVLGGLCKRIYDKYPNESVLILSHVQEILQQDYNTLQQYLPWDKIGLYSAGLSSKDIKQFTVAGIQSVYKLNDFNNHRLVIVDEAHLIPPSGEGRYRTFFTNNPNTRIVGLTATPYRLGLGLLTDGLFDRVVFNKDVLELIKEGYLCNLTCKETSTKMSVRDVKVTAGEYNTKDLSQKLDVTSLTKKIIKELTKYKDIRKHWLVFCIDIAHAEHVTDCLKSAGISAACVHSRMDLDRKEIIELYKAEGFQALVSVETLTTGFDAPNVDMVALLRPTMSPVLHVQMIGRGLRLFEGKKDCLILDFAGNVARLGPINCIRPPKKGNKKTGKPPTRVCPECEEINHISARNCVCCGYEFPVTVKLTSVAGKAEVLSDGTKINTFTVSSIAYTKHTRIGKPDMLRVAYTTSCMRVFYDYISLEGVDYALYKANHWWRVRSPIAVPQTVEEALEHVASLKKPTSITVDESGKYPLYKGYTWS